MTLAGMMSAPTNFRPGSGRTEVPASGRFLGVDLAWGERNRTGLAVLDGAGRLIASTAVHTDAEIAV